MNKKKKNKSIKACINQGVFLLIINLLLIFVPCRFGFQFISVLSSLFLFIYLFFVYLINYILLLLLLLKNVYE